MIESQPEPRRESGHEDESPIVNPHLMPQPSDSTLIIEPGAASGACTEVKAEPSVEAEIDTVIHEPSFADSDSPDQTIRLAPQRNESRNEPSIDPLVETALSATATSEEESPEIASPIKPLSAASTQPIPILSSTESSPMDAQPPLSEPAPSKGLPAWIWAIVGAGFAVALAVVGWFVWGPGLAPFRSTDDGSSASAEVERQPTPSPQAAPTASPQTPETPSTSTEVPAELRAYFDKANQGDAKAMHMLAVMYYNGLNVRQNREEGLKWYRKAAEAGSQAALKELKQIETVQK